jgi:hypothetical protein
LVPRRYRNMLTYNCFSSDVTGPSRHLLPNTPN